MAGCDTVFHLQANADVRGGQDRTRIDLEQNTLTTWNVLEAMRGVGANTIIFSSSATVYGEPSVFPTPEDHPLVQTSLYGASKLSGEAMIQAYAEYFGMRGVIFRFVSCVGPRYGHGVIVDFLRKLRADPTRLDILGDGTQRKSYLDVRDAITGLFLALQTDAGPKAIFNLGHDDFLTVMQVARIVLDELRLPAARIQCGTTTRGWLGDSPFVHLDTSRIKSLGWRAKFSIEQSLRDTVQDLLKRHE
jgi:UDP-glucose 4-epimerase